MKMVEIVQKLFSTLFVGKKGKISFLFGRQDKSLNK